MWWESQQPPGPTVVVILLPRHLRSLSDGWALAFPGLGDCRAGARGHHFGQVTRNVALVACLSQFFVRDYVNMCGVFGIIICESLFNLCLCLFYCVVWHCMLLWDISYSTILYTETVAGVPQLARKKNNFTRVLGMQFYDMLLYVFCLMDWMDPIADSWYILSPGLTRSHLQQLRRKGAFYLTTSSSSFRQRLTSLFQLEDAGGRCLFVNLRKESRHIVFNGCVCVLCFFVAGADFYFYCTCFWFFFSAGVPSWSCQPIQG